MRRTTRSPPFACRSIYGEPCMSVCMCVYVHACCTYACLCACMLHVCVSMCMHVVRMRVYVHACCTYVCLCACMLYVCVSMCMHVVRMCVYVHACCMIVSVTYARTCSGLLEMQEPHSQDTILINVPVQYCIRTRLYSGHFLLVPKVFAFRGSTLSTFK